MLIVDALLQGPFLVFSIEFPGTERERQAMVDIKLAVSGPWSLLFPLPGPPEVVPFLPIATSGLSSKKVTENRKNPKGFIDSAAMNRHAICVESTEVIFRMAGTCPP